MKVNSLSEYIAAVHKITDPWDGQFGSTLNPWFRGVSNVAKNRLIPGAYRPGRDWRFEREMLRDFKLQASANLETLPVDDIEWLCLLQHYGGTTRLLDWTESSLVGLYFACCKPGSSEDACVWVLNAWSLNSAFHAGLKSVPVANGTNKHVSKYLLLEERSGKISIPAPHPIAIRPPRRMGRIVPQRGMFTLFGSVQDPLEQIAAKTRRKNQILLAPIIVPGVARPRILKELYHAGVTHGTILPELQGLASELAYRFSDAFLIP